MSTTTTVLPFARLDFARKERTGFGETVFGAGKTPEQLARICAAFRAERHDMLATRCTAEQAEYLTAQQIPHTWDPVARTIVCTFATRRYAQLKGSVAVVTGGTADIPVAEEAAQTVSFFGGKVARYYDCGVAGLHRLLNVIDAIRKADVVIAVAGMEGALGSVVSGLVSSPVIAVPTSVGYGAGAGGLAPLLAMLNSCAEGLTVVNVDNGFGAAVSACRMLRLRRR